MSEASGMTSNPVVITPEDEIRFPLVDSTAPTATLNLKNESDAEVMFKVKTTKPMRYLVRPNQGLMKRGGSETIVVILQQRENDELLRQTASERSAVTDKFLVQTAAITNETFESVNRKSGREHTEELTQMWANASRRSVHNKKLRCKFEISQADASSTKSTAPENDSIETTKQLSSALLRDDHSNSGSGRSSFSAGQADSNNVNQVMSDVAALRSKYDELVAFTVQLTSQRDSIMNDLEKTKQQLQKAKTELERTKTDPGASDFGLRNRKGNAGANGTDGSGLPAGSAAVVTNDKPFGLFHLLICAVVFYLLGRYYA